MDRRITSLLLVTSLFSAASASRFSTFASHPQVGKSHFAHQDLVHIGAQDAIHEASVLAQQKTLHAIHPLHGSAVETLHGAGIETLRGATIKSLHGSNIETIHSDAGDAFHGVGVDTVHGGGFGAFHGAGVETVHGASVGAFHGADIGTVHGSTVETLHHPQQHKITGQTRASLGLSSLLHRKCGHGLVRRIDGSCVKPIVNKNIFLYNAPESKVKFASTPKIPHPKIDFNYVFIKAPSPIVGPSPLIVPPTKQKTMVYVLSEQPKVQQQEVIELESEVTQPEVFFINFKKGENPILPGGIDLQTALSQSAQSGKFVGEGLGGVEELIGHGGAEFVGNAGGEFINAEAASFAKSGGNIDLGHSLRGVEVLDGAVVHPEHLEAGIGGVLNRGNNGQVFGLKDVGSGASLFVNKDFAKLNH